ncbi:MAG: cystathionine beta-lyase [Arenicella sp.]|jgi:cystathionine beta-lyase
MENKTKLKNDTKLIQLGRQKKWTGSAVNPSIVRASTIIFENVAQMQESNRLVAQGATGVESYGRRGTSTTHAFAAAIADLDNAAGCYVYPCGASAITASLLSFLSAGDHLLMVDSVYEPTRHFCANTLGRLGITTSYYDPMLGADIEQLIQTNTKVIFMEAPGSLTMEVQDVPAITKVAKRHKVITMIDNTYATSVNFKPLDFGVDIAIQSATKYICGHSDVMLGVACANQAAWNTLHRNSYDLGLCASADDIYTGLRGIRTLGVRLRQHDANAMQVAKWLDGRDEVDHIRHPAFSSCPGSDVFKRDFDGGNGLFSFVLNRGDDQSVAVLVDSLRHFKIGFSWGGYESLILPASNLSAKRSATQWKVNGPLLRVHIGLEDPSDLIQDLEQGFARFNASL